MDVQLRSDALDRNAVIGSIQAVEMADGFALIRRWQDFLDVAGRANASTRRQYRRALVAFLADLCKDPRTVTEDDVISWLVEHDPKGGARKATIRAGRSFYQWALEREHVAANPFRAIPVPRPKYGRARYLDPADLARIFAAARSHRDPRVGPTLELMYHTGARVGSVVGIESGDIDLERGWIDFRIAKNADPYGVPLSDAALRACQELLALADYKPATAPHRRTTLVGVGRSRVMQWVQEVEAASGVECWSHLLRHTMATRLMNDPSVPPLIVAELLNHKSLDIVMKHYASGDEEMKRAAVAAL